MCAGSPFSNAAPDAHNIALFVCYVSVVHACVRLRNVHPTFTNEIERAWHATECCTKCLNMTDRLPSSRATLLSASILWHVSALASAPALTMSDKGIGAKVVVSPEHIGPIKCTLPAPVTDVPNMPSSPSYRPVTAAQVTAK